MKQVTPDDLMTELSDLRVEIYNFKWLSDLLMITWPTLSTVLMLSVWFKCYFWLNFLLNFLVHELSHAQHAYIGYDNKEILNNYKRVNASGRAETKIYREWSLNGLFDTRAHRSKINIHVSQKPLNRFGSKFFEGHLRVPGWIFFFHFFD